MTAAQQKTPPRPTPCGNCPYRKDCPSGVWHESEYLKLLEYDKETGDQPLAVFGCHSDSGASLCRGWLDAQDKNESLSLRLAVSFGRVDGSIFDLPKSEVSTFASGTEAALHGLKEIEHPSPHAVDVIRKLSRKISKTKGRK